MKRTVLMMTALCIAATRGRADPPLVHHEAVSCAVAGQRIPVCAIMTANKGMAEARLYFRPAGEKYYSYTPMTFGPHGYCATLPAPRKGKNAKLEYYLYGTDNDGVTRQTAPYPMDVVAKDTCPARPAQDSAAAGVLKVFATDAAQGRLPRAFDATGVTFTRAKK